MSAREEDSDLGARQLHTDDVCLQGGITLSPMVRMPSPVDLLEGDTECVPLDCCCSTQQYIVPTGLVGWGASACAQERLHGPRALPHGDALPNGGIRRGGQPQQLCARVLNASVELRGRCRALLCKLDRCAEDGQPTETSSRLKEHVSTSTTKPVLMCGEIFDLQERFTSGFLKLLLCFRCRDARLRMLQRNALLYELYPTTHHLK